MTPVLNLRFRFFIRAVLTQTRVHSCKKPLYVRTMADDRVHSGGCRPRFDSSRYWCRLLGHFPADIEAKCPAGLPRGRNVGIGMVRGNTRL
jgi:hypothetical protein